MINRHTGIVAVLIAGGIVLAACASPAPQPTVTLEPTVAYTAAPTVAYTAAPTVISTPMNLPVRDAISEARTGLIKSFQENGGYLLESDYENHVDEEIRRTGLNPKECSPLDSWIYYELFSNSLSIDKKIGADEDAQYYIYDYSGLPENVERASIRYDNLRDGLEDYLSKFMGDGPIHIIVLMDIVRGYVERTSDYKASELWKTELWGRLTLDMRDELYDGKVEGLLEFNFPPYVCGVPSDEIRNTFRELTPTEQP